MNELPDNFSSNKSRWRPWREITLIMLMIMEVSWVVPWYRSLTPATYSAGTIKAFIIFFAMIIAAHVLVRLLNYLRLRIVIRQSAMVLVLLASILIGYKYLLYSNETNIVDLINRPIQSFADWGKLIPDEFIVALAVILGWWRGISLAQAHVGPHLVMSNFNLGIFMFFIFGFINTLVTGETPGVLLYIFIFASLLAMSSSRMFIIHILRGGGEGVFDRRWFGGILFAAFMVVLLAGFSSSILGEGSGIVGYLIAGLFYVVSVVIFIFLSPILLLFIWIFNNLPFESEFFNALSGSLNNLRTMMQNALNNLGDLFNQSGIARVINEWGPDIKAVILWGIFVLAIIGVATWAGYQVWKARNKKKLDEDQQSILDTKDIWRLLRSTLEDRLKDLWGSITGLSVFSGSRRLHAAERVRQIYIEMMEMCQALNHPRPEAATPIEFMPDIKELFPKFTEDIEVITLAYNRVRYGKLPEDEREIQTVESAWERVEQEGRSLIEIKKRTKKPPEIVPGGIRSD